MLSPDRDLPVLPFCPRVSRVSNVGPSVCVRSGKSSGTTDGTDTQCPHNGGTGCGSNLIVRSASKQKPKRHKCTIACPGCTFTIAKAAHSQTPFRYRSYPPECRFTCCPVAAQRNKQPRLPRKQAAIGPPRANAHLRKVNGNKFELICDNVFICTFPNRAVCCERNHAQKNARSSAAAIMVGRLGLCVFMCDRTA